MEYWQNPLSLLPKRAMEVRALDGPPAHPRPSPCTAPPRRSPWLCGPGLCAYKALDSPRPVRKMSKMEAMAHRGGMGKKMNAAGWCSCVWTCMIGLYKHVLGIHVHVCQYCTHVCGCILCADVCVHLCVTYLGCMYIVYMCAFRCVLRFSVSICV